MKAKSLKRIRTMMNQENDQRFDNADDTGLHKMQVVYIHK